VGNVRAVAAQRRYDDIPTDATPSPDDNDLGERDAISVSAPPLRVVRFSNRALREGVEHQVVRSRGTRNSLRQARLDETESPESRSAHLAKGAGPIVAEVEAAKCLKARRLPRGR
jgi:hypothetical protein